VQAATSDLVIGAPIEQEVAARQLLPVTHLVDSGSGVVDWLVSAPRDIRSKWWGLASSPPVGRNAQAGAMMCTPSGSTGPPGRRCPPGHSSVQWTPWHSQEGHAVICIRFDKATCDTCTVRQAWTSSTKAPRQMTVKPQVHHEAIRAAHGHHLALSTPCIPQISLLAPCERHRPCRSCLQGRPIRAILCFACP